jgi:hypothetical protein
VFGKSLLERWVEGGGSPHLAIIGRTGAGKTSLCKKIVLYLLEKDNVAILDFDGEYGDMPMLSLSPPFHVPRVPLSWLISQVVRPEEGGFGIAGALSLLDTDDIEQAYAQLRHDLSLPPNIRFAALWRLSVLRRYFVFDDTALPSTAVYNLSSMNVRERQVAQQVLASLLTVYSGAHFIVVEEGLSGTWMKDILALARRRGKRLIFVSQNLPEDIQNFEVLLFTPYITNPRTFPLPLPVNPATECGVWWVGGLGVHRLKLPR